MAYIGREPTNSGEFLLIDDISGEFNGSKSSFTLKIGGLEITPAASNTIISLDGVLQEANDAYTISGSTISFTGIYTKVSAPISLHISLHLFATNSSLLGISIPK